MLKYVGYYLDKEWERAFGPLRLELEGEGVTVFCSSGKEIEFQCLTEEERRGMVFLTDCASAAERMCALGIACVGMAHSAEDLYFEGAELVLMSFEGVDRRDLEEWLLRCHGLPVTIARTERLLLREIAAADCPSLYQISLEPGMELAREDEEGENCFLPERLMPYAAHVYRLYGYGLWSVILPEAPETSEVMGAGGSGADACESGQSGARSARGSGADACESGQSGARSGGTGITADAGIGLPGRVIGCCGFAPYRGGFEMEYMLSAPYRGQGFGTEMCQAALSYAAGRLGAQQVWIRVRRENTAARRFAEHLRSCGILPIRIICE